MENFQFVFQRKQPNSKERIKEKAILNSPKNKYKTWIKYLQHNKYKVRYYYLCDLMQIISPLKFSIWS